MFIAQNLYDVGEELADDEAAWHEATIYADDIFKDVDGRFRPGQEWSLEVTNRDRRPIYFISIGSRKMP
ncbi:hypothetical protein MA20_11365 [Bradyrhizobium japonicum]|uniref:DUF6894 domain-containing protein n=1 Tax=Bradyrhizobium japonicum TaxID=375 RepID=A0A0A3Y1T3_BRAJP|nr:hypothetical protein MA20_11365 [Bradyrhizobium japonicum]